MNAKSKNKQVIIIAGPNGAGKTTFAMNLIDAGLIEHFVNADEMAKEFASQGREVANRKASKLFLSRIDAFVAAKESFAFETTLSGKAHLNRIRKLQANGWTVCLYYLFIDSVDLSQSRVEERVLHGGHSIPLADIRRRYPKGLINFFECYLPLVDYCECIHNASVDAQTVFKALKGEMTQKDAALFLSFKRCLDHAKH
jgi:predicted ABC-type ATPase